MELETALSVGAVGGTTLFVVITKLATFIAEKRQNGQLSTRPQKSSPLPSLAVEDSARIRAIHEVICRKDEETGAWLLIGEARRIRRGLDQLIYLLTPESERHRVRPPSMSDAE